MITTRRPEFFVVVGGGLLARGVRAEIPLFFGRRGLQSAFRAIATLLFFRESAQIDILTKRVVQQG
jgi:hypothetical protein